MTRDWLTYFDRLGDQSPLHRVQSALYVESLTAAVGVKPDQRVLDFGCGFGFVAAMLAPLSDELWFWDPSPSMRSAAERRTAEFPNAVFCDVPAKLSVRQDGTQWEGPPFDLILVNSVAQYMPPDELWTWLDHWQVMLAPTGKAILSDLIPPRHNGVSDIADLLRLGTRRGLPVRAIREALGGFGSYWRTSRTVPLVRIGEEELRRHAVDADLVMNVLPHNLTHFSKRWTAVLSRRPS